MGPMRALLGATWLVVACSRPAPPTEAPPPAPTAPLAATPSFASPPSASPAPSSLPRSSVALPPPPVRGVYLGRTLAKPMSYQGADWLERSDRELTDRPEHVLDVIALKPDDTVADVGAGSGYFTERIARRLTPRGRVIATDLQPEMLAMIRKKMAAKALTNVEPRLATETDSALPPAAVDVALMVDVYHELPRPDLTLQQVRASLRRGGRLVLVEYRGEDASVPVKPEHKMTLAQIRRELEASAFSVVSVDESLPHQRIVIAKPAE